MSLQTLVPLVLKASVLLSVFAIGLKASAQDATYLVALAVSPIPPLLPKKMVKAGGTESYSIGLLTAAALLAIIFVPVAMEVLEQVFEIPLQMTMASIAILILTTVLLPLGNGFAVHSLMPALAECLAKPISQIAGIGLLACIVAILFAAAPAIWTLVGNGTLLALAAFVVFGLAVGHGLGGRDRESHHLALSTASRHPGIFIALAQANFPSQKAAIPRCCCTCSSTQ